MKDFLLQHTKSQMEQVKSVTKSNRWKMVYGIGFLTGFLLLIILGKALILESNLLDVDSLREVKDCVVDKKEFLSYVFRGRLLWFLAGVVLWWWGYGKWYIYGVLGVYGFVMGACLQTTILRYSTKGVFLWMVLYFPHAILYIGALLCAMMLADSGLRGSTYQSRKEKIAGLLQKWLIAVGMLFLFVAGIYCEGSLNLKLLQNYLQFF